MRFASALPRIALGLYGAIGLVINAQALAGGRGPVDVAMLVAALALDAAALYAAVRFDRLAEHTPLWLERLVGAIMAYLAFNAIVNVAWRGGAPFYYLLASIYVLVGVVFWRAVLARISTVTASPSDERSDAPPTDG